MKKLKWIPVRLDDCCRSFPIELFYSLLGYSTTPEWKARLGNAINLFRKEFKCRYIYSKACVQPCGCTCNSSLTFNGVCYFHAC